MSSAQHRTFLIGAITLLTSALFASSSLADKVWLDNGNFLEGSARELETGEVEISSSLGVLRISKDRVSRIERSVTIEQKVRDFLDQNPNYGAEDLYELALESKAEGASTLANLLFEKTLRHDSDHEGARRALGYLLIEGVWATEQERHEMRGETLFRGEWVSAETKMRILDQENARQLAATERRLLAAQIRAEQRSAQGPLANRSYGPYSYPTYQDVYLFNNGARIPYDQLTPAMPRFRKPVNNDRPLKPPRMNGKTREELQNRNG